MAMGSSCYALQARRTANQLMRSYNRALAPLGLEIAQFSTLCVVAAEQALSVAEMAAHLGVERSTLVRNLKLMERDGLIAQAGRDGRRVRYRISPRGTALLEQALPVWRDVQAAIGAALGRGDPRQSMRRLRGAARQLDGADGGAVTS